METSIAGEELSPSALLKEVLYPTEDCHKAEFPSLGLPAWMCNSLGTSEKLLLHGVWLKYITGLNELVI